MDLAQRAPPPDMLQLHWQREVDQREEMAWSEEAAQMASSALT